MSGPWPSAWTSTGYPGETFVAEFAGGEALTWRLDRAPGGVTPRGGSDVRWVPGTRDLCHRVDERARTALCSASPACAGGTQGDIPQPRSGRRDRVAAGP